MGRRGLPGIAPDHMGDVWPAWLPGADTADYGSATTTPEGPFTVRSTIRLAVTYTVGEYGLDDTGAIKIVQRWPVDQPRGRYAFSPFRRKRPRNSAVGRRCRRLRACRLAAG